MLVHTELKKQVVQQIIDYHFPGVKEVVKEEVGFECEVVRKIVSLPTILGTHVTSLHTLPPFPLTRLSQYLMSLFSAVLPINPSVAK